MNVLGLIPARGGSKSILHKNIALLRGVPLIEFTLSAAHRSRRLTRTIISTDDAQIAEIGRTSGIEVPFMRPNSLAADDSPMIDVINHALAWLHANEGYDPQTIVLLQPTSPLRTAEHIDGAVDLFDSTSADSVVSVVEVPHQYTPTSIMRISDGRLVAFDADGAVFRRQDKPRFYARNGPAVLVTRPAVLASGRLYGDTTRPYLMTHADSIDVDTPEDLLLAEFLLGRRS